MKILIQKTGREIITPSNEEALEISQFLDSEDSNEVDQIPVNIYEDDYAYRIELLSPGFVREDFAIELNENGIFTISTNTDKVESEDGELVLRKEFSIVDISCSFQIPEDAFEGEMEVFYEGGILTLIISKEEDQIPEII